MAKKTELPSIGQNGVNNHHQDIIRHFPVIIVTGDKGSGKTTFIKEIVSILDEKKITCYGFYAEGTWDSQKIRNTFTITLLPSKENILLCNTITENWPLFGRFRFNPDAISKGTDLICKVPSKIPVIIDEIGLMELNGNVWSMALTEITDRNQNPIIITVRRQFLDNVRDKWYLNDAIIFDASTDCPEDAARMVVR